MRILYLNAYLNRFDFWTGERGRQFVNALLAAGADVETWPEIPTACEKTQVQPDGLVARVKQLAKAKLPSGALLILIEIYLVGRGLYRTLQLAWQAWRNRPALQADVVLARTFEYEWSPWLAAAILRRPLILEVHAPFFVERRFRGRGSSRFFKWHEGVLWRRAARIWVHTRPLEQIVADNTVDPERIRMIPFGLPDDHFGTASRPGDGRQAGDDGAHINVVFVGSFYPWHGVDLIVEAFSIAHEKIADLRLCLIGEGVTRAANEKRVRALGLEDVVEFPGWLSQEQLLSYLKTSEIGVAPYRKLEPFYFEPVKIMDYMAAGLAVIASDQGQIRDLVASGESGLLVPPEDVPALAQALVELAENAPLRQRLGQMARASVPTLPDTARRVLATASEVTAADREAPRGSVPARQDRSPGF